MNNPIDFLTDLTTWRRASGAGLQFLARSALAAKTDNNNRI
ncbi:MAG: hypothetical protein AB7O69_05695 [Burkholderiales bacterium]